MLQDSSGSSNGYSGNLLGAFRTHYSQFENAVSNALLNETDVTVLARLGDDLDKFASLTIEVRNTFYVVIVLIVMITRILIYLTMMNSRHCTQILR